MGVEMKISVGTTKQTSKMIKKCHVCGHVMESRREIEKCEGCKKPFLPMNYFGKVHAKNSEEFKNLFVNASDLHEEDMIKGLTVLW